MKHILAALLLTVSAVSAQTIVNPSPASGTFDKMWVQSADINFSVGYLQAKFVAYDGQNILGNNARHLQLDGLAGKQAADATLKARLETLTAYLGGIASNTSGVNFITVKAPEPGLPVRVLVQFNDGKGWDEADCFTRAARDQQFASVFFSTMTELARQAGLTVTQ